MLMVQANATLLVRHHRLSDEPDDLFRHLYQLCTYHLEVRGLASGRSGAVSGEVRRPPLPSGRTDIIRSLLDRAAPRSRYDSKGCYHYTSKPCGTV